MGVRRVYASNGEGAFHLGGLELSLGAFPMAVDVGGHLQRGVPRVSGQPGDLGAALEGSLRERVPEAVEGPQLLGRPGALDSCSGHRRIELASKQVGGREKALRRGRVEDEVLLAPTPCCAAPLGKQLNDVGIRSTSRRSLFLGVPTAPPV